jgi:hypothetical protein
MSAPNPIDRKERDVVSECVAVLAYFRNLHVWRNNSGVAWLRTTRDRRHPDGMMPVRFGIPGQADFTGIIAPSGRRIEIECKSDTGRQSVDQRAFEEMIREAGGIYLLVRSGQELVEALTREGIRPRRAT